MEREISAGGVVARDKKLLLIRVKNLLGKKIWTFPKGHIEAKENPEQAARREVREETGWTCKILRLLSLVRYRFKRDRRWVHKTVIWYQMKPIVKSGRKDPKEVLSVRWMSPEDAAKRLQYPSDLRLLKTWKSHG